MAANGYIPDEYMAANGLFALSDWCYCETYSFWTWLTFGLAFLSGYMWQRGVRYKEHMVMAIIVSVIALLVSPVFISWPMGTSFSITLLFLIAAAGYALARYKDAPKVAFSNKD